MSLTILILTLMKKILLSLLFVLTMYLPALAAVSSKDSLYRIERERAIELDSILRVRAPEFFEWEKIQEDTRNEMRYEMRYELIIAKILAIAMIIFTFKIIFPKELEQRRESIWGLIVTMIIAFVLYLIYY